MFRLMTSSVDGTDVGLNGKLARGLTRRYQRGPCSLLRHFCWGRRSSYCLDSSASRPCGRIAKAIRRKRLRGWAHPQVHIIVTWRDHPGSEAASRGRNPQAQKLPNERYGWRLLASQTQTRFQKTTEPVLFKDTEPAPRTSDSTTTKSPVRTAELRLRARDTVPR